MSTFGDSQVRNLFIAKAVVTPVAADGDVGVAEVGDNLIVSTMKGGVVYTSAPINKEMILSNGQKQMPITTKTHTITPTGAPVVGEGVELVVYLDSFGAHNTTDATTIRGWHKNKTTTIGDTLDGLADTITQTIEKSAIKGVTVTSNGSVIIVEFTRSDYKLGKFDGKVTQGRVLAKDYGGSITFDAVVADGTALMNGVEVSNLEWFAEGNRGDVYRGTGYPNNFDGLYVADITKDYEFYEIAFYSERISAPGDKQRQMITVAEEMAIAGDFETAIDAILNPVTP